MTEQAVWEQHVLFLPIPHPFARSEGTAHEPPWAASMETVRASS